MRITKLKRKLIKCVGLGAALTILLLLAMPVWFGWILRPVLEEFDTQYTHYERIGYGRFALSGVQCDLAAVNFQADRIELHTPSSWLWRIYLGAQDDARPYLSVRGWRLEIKDQPNQPNQLKKSESTFVPLPVHYQTLETVLRQLQQWTPSFAINDGTVVFGDQAIAMTQLALDDSKLSLTTASPAFAQGGTLSLDFRDPESRKLSITLPAHGFASSVKIAGGQSEVSVTAKTTFQENQIDWFAEFGLESFIPIRATLASEAFRIPAERLRTQELAEVTGALSAVWSNDGLNLNLKANAIAPDSAATVRDSVEFSIQASHMENLISLNQFSLKTDWLHISGSTPLKFDYSQTQLTEPAAISIDANLGRQKWINATGTVIGEVQLIPQGAVPPEVALKLGSESLSIAGFQAGMSELHANLSWPLLEISKAEIRFAGEELANLSATVNLADRVVTKGKLAIESLTAPETITQKVSYQNAALISTFEGPIERLSHSGELKINRLTIPQLRPMDFETEWSAKSLNFEHVKVGLSANETKLEFDTSISRSNQALVCTLQRLNLTQGKTSILDLSNRAEIRWNPKETPTPNGPAWTITTTPIRFQGDAASVSVDAAVDFPESGHVSANVNGLTGSHFKDFISATPPNISIDDLNLSGGWTNGPLEFLLETSLSVPINEELRFFTNLKAKGDSNGVTIENANVSNDAGTILEGVGNIPLTFHPSTPQEIHKLDSEGPIHFRISTTTNESFWAAIGKLSNLTFTEPELELNIAGSISTPSVQLSATTEAISFNSAEVAGEISSVKNLRGRIELHQTAIRLKELSLEFQGQPVIASAEAPVHLKSTVLGEFVDWRKTQGRIKIQDADLSQIASAFPTQLSPQGILNLDLEISPNLQWNGTMKIDNAATRPIPSIGSIQEIHGDIRFLERQLIVESLHGSVGGSQINLSGVIDFAEEKLRDGFPLTDLKIQSENTPLVRRPDLVLRTDLDLAISNATNSTPVVSGLVRLRDSFFLSDVKALQPGGVSTPDRRPPYFSIASPLLENWRLQLKVEGNEFLRIQTPLFSGRASTHMELENTLREPIALGDVTLNSGTIQFPFANLQITQGFVSLTSENPYQPELLITARSPVFGYDVTMSVRGPANEPSVELSSTPSLSSEQIMLMMTAGELPKREITFTRQQKATRMGMFLGKGLLSKFSSGSGGADRLTIRSGEYVSSEGKQTYSVEYRLTDQWSLVGEYDRFSQFNADLKWKFFSK